MRAIYGLLNSDEPTEVEVTNADELANLAVTVRDSCVLSEIPAIEIEDGSGSSLVFAQTERGVAILIVDDDHSYHSLAVDTVNRSDSSVTAFTYLGEYSEIPVKYTLSQEWAQQVVRAYFSGGMSAALQCAEWEADW